MKKLLILIVLISISILACNGVATKEAKGFSAELVHKISPDSPETVYSIFVSNNKYRINLYDNPSEYIIVSKNDSLSYNVSKSSKSYITSSIKESNFDDPILAWDKLINLFTKELEEKEIVLGYDCTRSIYANKTKAMIADWYSDSLKFFVKRQFKVGNSVSTMYLRNIEMTLLDDSLFVVPDSYTLSKSLINTEDQLIAELRRKPSKTGEFQDMSPMGKLFKDSTSIIIKTDKALETKLRFDNYDNKPLRASVDVFMQGLKIEFEEPIRVELSRFKDRKEIEVPLKGDSIRINFNEGFGFVRLEQFPGDIKASIKVQRLYLAENQKQIILPFAGKGTRIEVVGDNLNNSDSRFEIIAKKKTNEVNKYAIRKGESEIFTFPADSETKQIVIKMDKNCYAKLVVARGDIEKIKNYQE